MPSFFFFFEIININIIPLRSNIEEIFMNLLSFVHIDPDIRYMDFCKIVQQICIELVKENRKDLMLQQ